MNSLNINNADNLEATMDANGVLTLKVDTKQRLYRSQSGRNVIISTTHGQQRFLTPDGKEIKINLNLYA